MLRMAFLFLLIALVAAVFGFTTLAGATFAIAQVLVFLFFAMFVLLLVLGLRAVRRIAR